MLALTVAYFYFRHRSIATNQLGVGKLLFHSFYLDALYHVVIARPVEKLSAITLQMDARVIDGLIHASAYAQVTFAHGLSWIDRYIVDGLVHGVLRLVNAVGSLTRSFQGGKIQLYIFWAVLGIIILLLSMSV
jgi:NADH-quinone oxidoreductase subunit L